MEAKEITIKKNEVCSTPQLSSRPFFTRQTFFLSIFLFGVFKQRKMKNKLIKNSFFGSAEAKQKRKRRMLSFRSAP